jgi:hypothetical protein
MPGQHRSYSNKGQRHRAQPLALVILNRGRKAGETILKMMPETKCFVTDTRARARIMGSYSIPLPYQRG